MQFACNSLVPDVWLQLFSQQRILLSQHRIQYLFLGNGYLVGTTSTGYETILPFYQQGLKSVNQWFIS